MGRLGPDRGNGKYNVEFELTAFTPNLRLSVYLVDESRSRTSHSQRFDFKARAREEDPESRRDLPATDKMRFLGDVSPYPVSDPWGEFRSFADMQLGPMFSHPSMEIQGAPHGRRRAPLAPYRDWVCVVMHDRRHGSKP